MEWTALITTKQSLMQSPTGARSTKMEKKRRMPKKGSISVKSDSNRMEELLDCFAFKKVPTVERARKRDMRKESKDAPEKKPKLLSDILSGENLPSLVPSYTTNGNGAAARSNTGIPVSKEPSSRWSRVPLPLSKRDPILAVQHWEREGSVPYTPPSDIPLHPTSVIEYTGAFLRLVVER